MNQKVNYWTWKDSEIVQQLEDYELQVPSPFNRKQAIETLKQFEMDKTADDIAETMKAIKQEKIEKPKLVMIKVIFHSTGEEDMPYVPIGHNGRAFYLPKEQEILVPKYLLDSCIKDAVEHRLMPKVETNGDVNWIVRKVQRFPYTIVDFTPVEV